jgi:hypothetical protein
MDIKDIQTLTQDRIEQERSNLDMFRAMDDMDYMWWSLPAPLQGLNWIRKAVSSDPHDALRDGTRLFASMFPTLNVKPQGPTEGDLKKANDIERALKTIVKKALRRKSRLQARIIKHAMKYDRVSFQVVYLPHQDKVAGIFSNNDKKRKHAFRFGDFAIVVRNPQSVFPIYNDWMKLDGVIFRQVMTINELNAFWGDRALKFNKRMALKKNQGLEYATIYDYWDFDRHVVWASPQGKKGDVQEPTATENSIILGEENELDFIPWVVEDGDQEQLEPLLYSIYKGGQWDDMNILDTLSLSEVIAYSAAPRGKKSGVNPEEIGVDYTEPGRDVELMPGEEYTPIPPPQMDRAVREMYQDIRARVNKSTISNIVQTGDIKSGTAFASLNKLVELGVKSLNPYKELSEEAMAELCYQIMYWLKFAGKPLVATAQLPGGAIADINQDVDMNIEDLDIQVELSADLPIDQVQRVNAAGMARQTLGTSKELGMTSIGIEDPKEEFEKKKQEDLADLEHQINLENIQKANARDQLLLDAEANGMAQGIAQAAAQQAAAAAQQGQQGQQGGGPPSLAQQQRNPQQQQAQAEQRGSPIPGGPGFSPPQGGQSPSAAAPEAVANSNQQRGQ